MIHFVSYRYIDKLWMEEDLIFWGIKAAYGNVLF